MAETHGVGVCFNRRIDLAQRPQRVAKIALGFGKVRPEGHGFAKLLEGAAHPRARGNRLRTLKAGVLGINLCGTGV